MKYTIEQILSGEDELILRYRRLNGEVEAVLQFMNAPAKKLIGIKNDTQAVIDFADVLYAEEDLMPYILKNTVVHKCG